ncbi:predicted protein [Histoplasma mississippiense (nom. inval.)]|uniref:predicted protein n=1 Tax=Ajellomyces capsulatus (strain NAm1 / WU24) TaxID=2059318 RepID=UPI000157B827|nr:predicted protein [Histoplasma mississippiense (nom. inval.)]EDN03935.1 predicted protein [Histoplasma mississippiense (nom. inval.)]
MALHNVRRPSPARSTLPFSRHERIIYTPLHPFCAQSPSAPRTASLSLSLSPSHSYHRDPCRSILLRSRLPRMRVANLTVSTRPSLTDRNTSPPRAGNEHERPQHCDSGPTPAPMHGTKGSNVTPLRQSLYEDPLDDTDEDLSDVPSDYGGSKQTKKLKLPARDRWQRYCAAKASEPAVDPQWFDAEEALQRASAKDLHRFWNWVLGKLERGKGGRKLKGTKKTSSLKSDWKYFQGYYRKVTGNGISEKMSEDVRRGMQSLADKHGLDNQPRENIPVYIEDMVPSTRQSSGHGRSDSTWDCNGSCCASITCWRDPHGGPPVPTVDFRPEFIKRNLGMGKLNTFVLPEIIFDVSLLFSPHIFLFGFLFHAEAFENSSLQTMEDVQKLVPAGGCQEMPLPLKWEMDNWYIFCKVDVQDGQVRILCDTPMSASTLDSQLKSVSEIHGFLNTFFSHQFRYGGGKLLDESGFVSDSQKNVIMNHATNRTFVAYYRTRRHTGLQEIMCGLKPDERTLSCRRPIRIREDLIDLYMRTRDAALVPLLQERQREVSNTRRRLQDKLIHKLRWEFSRNQAVVDIERQLSGSGSAVDDEGAREVLRTEFEMPPAQIHLLEKLLTWLTSDSLEDEWRRRNEAVEAVRQYCGFFEGGPLRGRPKRAIPPTDPHSENIPLQKKIRQEGCPAPPSGEKKCRAVENLHSGSAPDPLACFQCGKMYVQHVGVIRHFRTAHLNDRRCTPCDLALLCEMDLRKHAAVVHGVSTRPHSIC